MKIYKISECQLIMDSDEKGSYEGYTCNNNDTNLINFAENEIRDFDNINLFTNHFSKYQKVAIFKSLYVEENFRNQGIGNELVSNFIEEASSKGADVIYLIADEYETNEIDLIKWYESFGFEKLLYTVSGPLMYLEL
jgi:GNAT superfamily N-acetyltransferase